MRLPIKIVALYQLLFDAMEPLRRVLDGIDALLEDNLLRRVLEALARKPPPVRSCPVIAASRIDAPVS